MNCKSKVNIIKVNSGTSQEATDEIVAEQILDIYVNKEFYTSLMCTPKEKIELAIGFLFAEGVISSMTSIKSIVELTDSIVCAMLNYELEEDFRGRRAYTSGCANGSIDKNMLEESGISPVESSCRYKAYDVLSIMREFNQMSELFKDTGGVHSCAICSNTRVLYFSEDVGRHNAMDKIIGKALLDGISLEDKLLLTTGRISSEIAVKAARAGLPIVVSHSAPTDKALTIAQSSNLTIAGFARGNRMNIYCGSERIII